MCCTAAMSPTRNRRVASSGEMEWRHCIVDSMQNIPATLLPCYPADHPATLLQARWSGDTASWTRCRTCQRTATAPTVTTRRCSHGPSCHGRYMAVTWPLHGRYMGRHMAAGEDPLLQSWAELYGVGHFATYDEARSRCAERGRRPQVAATHLTAVQRLHMAVTWPSHGR